jgi:RNA polymerase sigma factor (TIGR02999 family)
MEEMENVPHTPRPVGSGVPPSSAELLPLVYEELRHLAALQLSRERPGQTLQPTALVHEAWLRLKNPEDKRWNDPAHFFAAAAQAMRRILVDNARHKLREKHGGKLRRTAFDISGFAAPLCDDDLLALDEALTQLADLDSAAAQLVELRFFGGLTHAQAAKQIGISRSTADRTWQFARAWLYSRIRPAEVENGQLSPPEPLPNSES